MTEVQRFASKFEPHPTEMFNGHPCWDWKASMMPKGYGQSKLLGEQMAHRVAYKLFVGPIPPGMTIDHLCRRRQCVNPSHLEVVTNKENILRGESPYAKRARQTHCLRGHAFDEANTERRPNGTRCCRTCKDWRSRKYRQGKRGGQ